jgi:hypothetical protein
MGWDFATFSGISENIADDRQKKSLARERVRLSLAGRAEGDLSFFSSFCHQWQLAKPALHGK